MLDASNNKSEWRSLTDSICVDHLNFLKYLKDKGLQIKSVPIQGYIAKDGDFVKKAP